MSGLDSRGPMGNRFPIASIVTLCLLFAACAQQGTGSARRAEAPVDGALNSNRDPKRLTVAIAAEPAALHRALLRGGVTQAIDVTDLFVNMGMTVTDDQGIRQPALAEAVPSIENGLWKVLPDGRMELLWKIRPGVAWHDGTPLTADDLLFTVQIIQDRDFPEWRGTASDLIERAEAADATTLSTIWKRPYVLADRLFTGGPQGIGQLMPKHLLNKTYTENREGFRQLPYWTTEYVGLGPYKLKDWVQGSHLTLEAYDGYVLGRPKIDEMVVRFILDPNATEANILSGAVQATVGTGISLEQSVEIRDQWREGQMLVTYENWILAYPQFINPNPQVVTDLRFRRALRSMAMSSARPTRSSLIPIPRLSPICASAERCSWPSTASPWRTSFRWGWCLSLTATSGRTSRSTSQRSRSS